MIDDALSLRADIYGKQVAQNVCDYGTALACLTALYHTIEGGYADPEWRLGIMAHVLGLHAERWETQRAIAEGKIQFRCRRLVERLASAEQILAEAENINTEYGSPLLTYEVRGIATQAMAALTRFTKRARQRG